MNDLLGRFLRDRRARITRAQAGLAPRRPGSSETLTQEDLAWLTGYSVRTISALEQGSGHRPTRELLDAITTALGLDADERRTLWHLAAGAAPPEAFRTGNDPHLGRLTALQEPHPACVCDAAYMVLVHNGAFAGWTGTSERAARPAQPCRLALHPSAQRTHSSPLGAGGARHGRPLQGHPHPPPAQ